MENHLKAFHLTHIRKFAISLNVY